jgi:hypothetical protein
VRVSNAEPAQSLVTSPATAAPLDRFTLLLGDDVLFVPCAWGTKEPLVTYVERPFEGTKTEAYRALFETEPTNIAVYLGAASGGLCAIIPNRTFARRKSVRHVISARRPSSSPRLDRFSDDTILLTRFSRPSRTAIALSLSTRAQPPYRRAAIAGPSAPLARLGSQDLAFDSPTRGPV